MSASNKFKSMIKQHRSRCLILFAIRTAPMSDKQSAYSLIREHVLFCHIGLSAFFANECLYIGSMLTTVVTTSILIPRGKRCTPTLIAYMTIISIIVRFYVNNFQLRCIYSICIYYKLSKYDRNNKMHVLRVMSPIRTLWHVSFLKKKTFTTIATVCRQKSQIKQLMPKNIQTK